MGADIVTAITNASTTYVADVGLVIAALAGLKAAPLIGRYLLRLMGRA